jgi:hypothetical protein
MENVGSKVKAKVVQMTELRNPGVKIQIQNVMPPQRLASVSKGQCSLTDAAKCQSWVNHANNNGNVEWLG